jgi:hypothetical protein
VRCYRVRGGRCTHGGGALLYAAVSKSRAGKEKSDLEDRDAVPRARVGVAEPTEVQRECEVPIMPIP